VVLEPGTGVLVQPPEHILLGDVIPFDFVARHAECL
jgi:hypothetical protein